MLVSQRSCRTRTNGQHCPTLLPQTSVGASRPEAVAMLANSPMLVGLSPSSMDDKLSVLRTLGMPPQQLEKFVVGVSAVLYLSVDMLRLKVSDQ
jgi:hypothetical protein